MGNYQTYEKYKDSGVEWLGAIPEHWDIWKVNHGFKNVGSGTTPKSDNQDFYDGDIPWITTSELRESLILDTSQKVTQSALKLHSALKLYPKGSIAIAMYGATIGRLGILGIDATVNQACCIFSESNIFYLPFFYYWLWMYRPSLIALSSGGGQPNLSQDDLRQIRLGTPPLYEQESIANFLDRKTKQIDDLIAKKEALLAKLDEKRSAIISHAVTKGLDHNVPMKISGVNWLGEIPEHWQAKKLKFVSSITRGAILRPVNEPSYFDENGEWYYLNISDVTKCERFLYTAELKLSELGSNRSARVLPNNLILTASATIGKPIINKVKVCIHDGFIAFKDISINILYLFYFFLDPSIYAAMGKTNTQKNIYLDEVKNVVIGMPSLEEQTKIVQYLDKKTVEIDLQKAKVQEAIERLKEYRTALITNAVTGKIDVRQVSLN